MKFPISCHQETLDVVFCVRRLRIQLPVPGGVPRIIEVWGWRRWALPFVWIGMNPITVYMFHNLVDVGKIAERFVGGDLNKFYLRGVSET